MITGKRIAPRTALWQCALALLTAHLCFLLLPCLFEPFRLRASDVLFWLRGGAEPGEAVVMIQISDGTETALGAELDSGHTADVVRALKELEASVQVHDAVFRVPNDALVEAAREAGNVAVGCVGFLRTATDQRTLPPVWDVQVEGDASALPEITGALLSFDALAAGVRGQGFIDIDPDRDGVLRHAPLLARCGDGYVPSLPLLAACLHLGVEPGDITVRPGGAIQLGDRVTVPIDERGRMRINHTRSVEPLAFERVRAARGDRMELDLLRPRVQGRIALVADLRTSVGDTGPTPFGGFESLGGVQASVLRNLLEGRFLRDVPTAPAVALELGLLAALVWLARRRTSALFLAGSLGLVVLLLALAITLFIHAGLVLDVVRPLLMLGVAIASLLVHRYLKEQEARAVLQASFEAYFAPALAKRLMDDPSRVTVGGRRKELTILFSDLKGFTNATSEMEPEAVQKLLNGYFEAMVDVVFAHGGTVDKLIGDGLMVFFGDPEEQPDHARRAVRCAIEMQHRVRGLDLAVPIEVRIGIHTGPVVVGNMGSRQRLSYTVLGSAVNLAARLEPQAPPGGILISDTTRAALDGTIRTRSAGALQLKGFHEPVEAHLVEL